MTNQTPAIVMYTVLDLSKMGGTYSVWTNFPFVVTDSRKEQHVIQTQDISKSLFGKSECFFFFLQNFVKKVYSRIQIMKHCCYHTRADGEAP